ncbi:bifunctional UGMP family protein/serine/threonine protein kinase [Halogeometricum borinquense DSM 11551]|uniref:Probable bifunctional tRNA threonylcarbamoyladenosine biosynthesis protein n=1 Tax=Halogeometricum borinquense (strain ATCC 700274 / DSM 11551 / JCM 10706 / KCTC 4070 / PR3) TaxID=469382 RepID=E4NM02_HALBP|nr:bifunctional N(6)-L-threonylcarbamoyladenine synthase/serine/threonine protein kinase [Halogeometricum borinquense]ADQ66101.1 O-sialoglycoprotein endopeptidase [Halogeometricum borinquense DSM 11551]ELY27403.1 bifunctional UGMP family protein/serine/threonine protein kinase [Halogeometricum borinquense DSM 11551]
MRIVGIEGTAWAASAALFDTATDEVFIESDPYEPDSGGIHPREAAEHMGDAIPAVVSTVLDHAVETAEGDSPEIDGVAFSRGPGLGPCLRIVGTAARSLAQTLDVPLVGVNHMVAHLEIGRYQSGFDSPVCLNASGANAHLLGYHNGRYRVLGETMDTGVGNAIDKFTRHVGWTHPGGPKVERAAKDGEYHDLPYVVKGMDFSFSGIMSAAKQASDDGVPVEDVCCGLQETIFAMLTEVAERALSLTGTDELVLGGGVGQNARLREMLSEMCDQRGADFYAPEPRFLRDNAGMIAVLGARMLAAGDVLPISDSAVNPNYRPDQVPVTWRDDEESVARDPTAEGKIRGAEATVTFEDDSVVKRRVPKTYRHAELDDKLRKERTRAEARLTSQARREGVPTPVIRDVDPTEGVIVFESVGKSDLAGALTTERCRTVGKHLATVHDAGFVHGDPTTRNVRVDAEKTYLIDFGLGYYTGHVEDHAMDLHVFGQSVEGTAAEPEPLLQAFEEGYAAVARDGEEGGGPDEDVLARLRQVEGRGRYQ